MLKKYCLFSLLFAFSVDSATYIVADTGRTIDIKAYLHRTESAETSQRPAFTANDAKVAVNASFPLVSTIPLGQLSNYKIHESLPANFALVGTGSESQSWLKKRYQDIKNTSAMVIVIDAPSIESYLAFEGVLKRAGLTVTKSSSKPFESIVKAYPALIANGMVTQ
jgi:hypothetical protein